MSRLAVLAAMSVALGVTLPLPVRRSTEGYERTGADSQALAAAEAKRQRKAEKRRRRKEEKRDRR